MFKYNVVYTTTAKPVQVHEYSTVYVAAATQSTMPTGRERIPPAGNAVVAAVASAMPVILVVIISLILKRRRK